jgi:phage gp29-like protein
MPGGKSTAQLVRAANVWRDNYNALRGLVIARVVSLMEAAQRGDFAELQLVLKRMERRFPVLKALKARRMAALEKLDWDIKVMEPLPAGVSEEQANAQREFLRNRYDLIENLTDTFGQLVLAEFRGFTILQKHRYQDGANDGAVREFHWLPQFVWSRAGEYGDWYLNWNSTFGIGGDACKATLGEKNRIGGNELPREEFIVREHDTPLYEIALIAFVNWSMGRKDWGAFVEVFGLPNAIVIMPPQIPTGKEAEYLAAAEKTADGVSGALPNGSDVKFPTAGVRGNDPFKAFCDAHVEDVVLAGTGGLLTMLSQPTGIGQGASGEHGDAFDAIAQADARRISETLQRDFDRAELNAAFPGQPVAAYFELCAREEEDVTDTITQIAALRNAGYPVVREQVEERTGFELEEPAGAPASGPAVPGAPASGPARPDGRVGNPLPAKGDEDDEEAGAQITNRAEPATSNQQLAAALARDLAPVLAALDERLARILEITDPALRKTKFDEAWAELAPLMKDIQADPATARALEKITAPALAKGLTNRAGKILNFDPDQPRDEWGRWTDGAGFEAVATGNKITITSKGKTQVVEISEHSKVEPLPKPYADVVKQAKLNPDDYVSIGGSRPVRVGVKPLAETAIAGLKARSQAAREELAKNVPGIEELRAERAAADRADYAFKKAMERGDGHLPARHIPKIKEADFPAAKAYLHAEGYSQASHPAKVSAGKTAMQRLANGEDYNQVLKDMEDAWSKEAERSVWNS